MLTDELDFLARYSGKGVQAGLGWQNQTHSESHQVRVAVKKVSVPTVWDRTSVWIEQQQH
jgi:hypothetical protein